ncbi:MAG: MFS transporter [Anaerolineae bacterium]|nr:MFS transporter [Anaerolineae bacterium]
MTIHQHHTPQTEKAPGLGAFFVIWGGQAVSLIGSELVQFALIWTITEQTRSGALLALASAMAILPKIVLAPVAGALVDRWNRRVVMIAADSLAGLVIVALAAALTLDRFALWMIFPAMFLRAIAGVFHWSAMQASTPLMVPADHLGRVAGLNEVLNGLMSIAAPPLGALLIRLLPLQSIFLIDVSTAILAVGTLLVVTIPQPDRPTIAEGKATVRAVLADLFTGLRFVWNWVGMRGVLLILLAVFILIIPAINLVPLLVTEYFGADVDGYAAMQTAFGIGLVVGGLIMSAWGGFKRHAVTMVGGFLAMGGFSVLIGLLPSNALTIAIGAMGLFGLSNAVAVAAIHALLQTTVPHDLQGRVMSVMMSLTSTAVMIGMALAGPISDLVGPRAWYLIGGAGTLAICLYALLTPAIIKMEDAVKA